MIETYKIHIKGMVQGIGFRPFVAKIADSLNLCGKVINYGGDVLILLQCSKDDLQSFINKINLLAPKSAKIDDIKIEAVMREKFDGFYIENSVNESGGIVKIPPDLSICENCRNELLNHKNRRYGYPLISCTECGPRFSIINSLPYDRENTVMKKFSLCKKCDLEYTMPKSRRRHAQTISCFDCGPQLYVRNKNNNNFKENAIETAVKCLQNGDVIAIKSIGGYHLVCDATNICAVNKCRMIKNREEKPFAVMFRDIQTISKYCNIQTAEKEMLNSSIKPIVLLSKKKDFAADVCKNSNLIGAMLPSNPIQTLLLQNFEALVMTSANKSGDAIIYKNSEIFDFQDKNDVTCVLFHERDILTPLDDSIFRYDGESLFLIRRARGIVPEPLEINFETDTEIFAAGGDLKASFALAKKNYIYLSQYFGDLENLDVTENYNNAVSRMKNLFFCNPKIKISDMHPKYISSKLFKSDIKIQHHHAHALSVMAEYGLKNCVAVILDGTGYGMDSNIWGGEVLYCNGKEFKRIGHISKIKLAGGEAAAKNADYCAYSNLLNSGIDYKFKNSDIYSKAVENNINCIYSTSAGRLFDAVSAVLDISKYNSFEGKCASMLEMSAENGKKIIELEHGILKEDDILTADTKSLVKDIFIKYKNGYNRDDLALSFHLVLAQMISNIAFEFSKKFEIKDIVLSGGCFQNVLLRNCFRKTLEEMGLNALFNKKIPPNDGGIAAGQAYYYYL